MNKFVELPGGSGNKIYFNVSQVSAVVANDEHSCNVYTTGDDEPFRVKLSASEVIHKFST